MKKFFILIVICIGAYFWATHAPDSFSNKSTASHIPFTKAELSAGDKAIQNAYDNKLSNRQVGGSGKGSKILPDDNKGSRHQRFIVKLDSNQTLLIAHNIDLAPRINDLRIGDHINFYGEYEWNPQGGVVHWTHHDPNNRHEGGWLNHGGKLYQ